jgi:hypothetical protein
VLDQNPAMTLAPASAITSGVWRDDVRPTAVWAGDAGRDAPVEIEVYSGGWGIMRTEDGWFPVTNVSTDDPTTHLRDAQRIFADALARMEDTDWLRAHDFVPPPSLP